MNSTEAAAPSLAASRPDLFLGRPHFPEADMARIARERGIEAAWREAFHRLGPHAPLAVTGGFAVAFSPRPGAAFLAVDRFARNTLCYRLKDGRLDYAERADELADSSTGLDLQGIYDYFHFHVIPAPRTIFRGVFRLPAGHYALFENGHLTVAPYWLPEFREDRTASFATLREEFLGLLETAVRDELAEGTSGCYLSGGTDSSTVAGMVRRVTGQGAATYSIGFEAEGYDEMEYARIAASHFGTDHHEYYVTPEDLVQGIPLVAGHYDQPFGNSSALPGYYCAKIARADGFTRMLAGDGGDELFGGNTRYAKQKVFDWYNLIPTPLRRGLLEPLSPLLAHLPLARKINSYVEQARVPMPERLHQYGLLERLGAENVLATTVLAASDMTAPLRQEREVWLAAGKASLVNHMLAFDWRYTLADNDLPKVCGTAALAGVQVGFPLLNERILDFSMKLPTDYKVRGLKLRWFFKEALRGFLPDEIITKKKHGFGLPFGVWATRHQGLKRLAEESVHSLADRGFVRREFVETLLATHLPAHPGYYGELVWIMMMLEQWLEKYAPSASV